MYGKKGVLTLTLDSKNSIVFRLPNGETIDIQMAESSPAKRARLAINADRAIQIFRGTRRPKDERKQ